MFGGPQFMKRAQISLFSALLFYIVSNPITYTVVDTLLMTVLGPILGSSAALFKVAEGGCPTGYGLLLHSFVFFLVTLGLMYL
jgi:hypothetical protein